MRKQTALVLFFLSLFFANTSQAMEEVNFVGTMETAIEAAMNYEEPAQNAMILDLITKKLIKFSIENGIYGDPLKELAFFHGIATTFDFVWCQKGLYDLKGTSGDAAMRISMDSSLEIMVTGVACAAGQACGDSEQTYHKIAYFEAFDEALQCNNDHDLANAVRKIIFGAAESALKKALENGASKEQAGFIAYRVAEWTFLNYLLENLESLVKPRYLASLAKLTEAIESNPFNNPIALKKFFDKQFGELPKEKQIYLSWLEVVFNRGFASIPQGTTILCAHFYTNSIFSFIPSELVTYILQLLLVQPMTFSSPYSNSDLNTKEQAI